MLLMFTLINYNVCFWKCTLIKRVLSKRPQFLLCDRWLHNTNINWSVHILWLFLNNTHVCGNTKSWQDKVERFSYTETTCLWTFPSSLLPWQQRFLELSRFQMSKFCSEQLQSLKGVRDSQDWFLEPLSMACHS